MRCIGESFIKFQRRFCNHNYIYNYMCKVKCSCWCYFDKSLCLFTQVYDFVKKKWVYICLHMFTYVYICFFFFQKIIGTLILNPKQSQTFFKILEDSFNRTHNTVCIMATSCEIQIDGLLYHVELFWKHRKEYFLRSVLVQMYMIIKNDLK